MPQSQQSLRKYFRASKAFLGRLVSPNWCDRKPQREPALYRLIGRAAIWLVLLVVACRFSVLLVV